ncbi:MAG: cysteine desulfurase / selenocysteine lyase [Solirubrobacteraceae bacterium]|jgi:cysteine desulfurase/selenocysteine lyase|nr:cysteine desulfurase, SufS subfamily [Solirubrobacterales bacterium]MEA2216467.1 cysteine desulfurase / selenocysteine lyase [Solirubrobacteraceae bacterium]
MPPVAEQALAVRADFPIFARRFGERPLVYLDSGATSQKPQVVIDALSAHLSSHNANVHRGVYPLAQEADAAFEAARERIAAFTGGEARTTIFTKNATEAINLVARSWGAAQLGPGDAVLITQMEHHANLVPWQQVCRERGAELRYLEVDEHGELSLQALDSELARGDVRLVAFTHVSNVLGTINPVAEISARARAAGAITLIDGAQAVPQMPVDIARAGADFYVWTGHKALGPTGIGVLHGRRELLESMEPFLTGGDMIASVGLQETTWNELPFKFEAGTPPIAEAVALAAAVDYLGALGMERVRDHERALTEQMLARLGEVPGLRVVGPPAGRERGALASFTVEGMHPHDVAELLGREGVCVRAGHHCAQPLMRCLGVSATARASLGVYNDESDVEALIGALQSGRAVFGL